MNRTALTGEVVDYVAVAGRLYRRVSTQWGRVQIDVPQLVPYHRSHLQFWRIIILVAHVAYWVVDTLFILFTVFIFKSSYKKSVDMVKWFGRSKLKINFSDCSEYLIDGQVLRFQRQRHPGKIALTHIEKKST